MKALVVYDSKYGNTEQIAQAIGVALGAVEDVQIRRVGDVMPDELNGLSLLIVGSPTQKFRPTAAISEFVQSISNDGLKGVKVAAFDTRITEEDVASSFFLLRFLIKIFGYASEPMAAKLEQKGGETVTAPERFYVTGMEGPLIDGELERASDWARQLLASV